MKLWLVRHARPLVEAGTCYGALDVAADAQATRAAAAALARQLPRGLRARSSPLRRCLQLAEALRALRPDLCFATDARLREMDFGAWEGSSWDAIGRAELERWSRDFAHHRCGGGESVDLFLARVRDALEQACHHGEDSLWITHAGVARAARLLAGGHAGPVLARDWPREGLAPGEATCLEVGPPGG